MMPSEGLEVIAKEWRALWNAGGANLKQLFLWENNVTPAWDSTLAFLGESTDSTYARIDLQSWAAPVINPDHSYSLVELLRSFTLSDAGTVRGWGIVDSADKVIAAVKDGVATTTPAVYVRVPIFNDQTQ